MPQIKKKIYYQESSIPLWMLDRKSLSGMFEGIASHHLSAANSAQGEVKQCCLYFK